MSFKACKKNKRITASSAGSSHSNQRFEMGNQLERLSNMKKNKDKVVMIKTEEFQVRKILSLKWECKELRETFLTTAFALVSNTRSLQL